MKFDDKNFSFERQQTERNRRQLSAPPLKKSKPGWKISGEDRQPPERWRQEFDSNGQLVLLEEAVRPTLARSNYAEHKSARSRFEILIRENCCVGGIAVPPGCKVICFAPTAALLAPRGKILAEERNSF